MADAFSGESKFTGQYGGACITHSDGRRFYRKVVDGYPRNVCKEALGYATLEFLTTKAALVYSPQCIMEGVTPKGASGADDEDSPRPALSRPTLFLDDVKTEVAISSEILGESPVNLREYLEAMAKSGEEPSGYIPQLGTSCALKALLGDDDNKPGNIIITTIDGKTIAYPIDFEFLLSARTDGVVTPDSGTPSTPDDILQYHLHPRGKSPETVKNKDTLHQLMSPEEVSEIGNIIKSLTPEEVENIRRSYMDLLKGSGVSSEIAHETFEQFKDRLRQISTPERAADMAKDSAAPAAEGFTAPAAEGFIETPATRLAEPHAAPATAKERGKI